MQFEPMPRPKRIVIGTKFIDTTIFHYGRDCIPKNGTNNQTGFLATEIDDKLVDRFAVAFTGERFEAAGFHLHDHDHPSGKSAARKYLVG